jgi:hypothetical protein
LKKKRIKKCSPINVCKDCLFVWWCLMPLSTIYQLYLYSIQTQGIKIQRYKKSWIMIENTKKILQIQTVEQWLRKKWNVLTFGDVNRFWSSSRKLKSSRQIDVERLYGRGSGINGAKSCILGLSWHLISLLKLHFFVIFFSYFQQLFKIKDPFLLLLIILWQWFRHFNLLTTKMY